MTKPVLVRVLIASGARRSGAEMRKKILRSHDADEVLQRAGHAGFHVGLELGNIQDHVGAQHGIAHRVTMRSVMMTVGVGGTVVGDAEARIYAEAHETATLSQIDERIAVGIARQRVYAADVTAGVVDIGPLLPQVEERHGCGRVIAFQLGEAALLAEAGEVAALQWCVGHVDAATARQRREGRID